MEVQGNKIPTAKDYLLEDYDISSSSEQGKVWTDDAIEKMIEFAKLHVQEALKQASNVELNSDLDYESGKEYFYQNIEGILNAYPEELIK